MNRSSLDNQTNITLDRSTHQGGGQAAGGTTVGKRQYEALDQQPSAKSDEPAAKRMRSPSSDNISRVLASMKTKLAKITDGHFTGALLMQPSYWRERLDENTHEHPACNRQVFDDWRHGDSTQNFDAFLAEHRSFNPKVKISKVQYLTEGERTKHYSASIRGNTLELSRDFPSNCLKDLKQFNESSRVDRKGKFDVPVIFTMGEDSSLFVGVKVRNKFQHSSFFSGAPVKGAGSMDVRYDQASNTFVIDKITSSSGHYAPDAKSMVNTLLEMQRQGADLTQIKFDLFEKTNGRWVTTQYDSAAESLQTMQNGNE